MIVLWRTTTRCNYACGFCAYDRRLGGLRAEVTELEATRFGEVLADWSKARGEQVLLSWLGGEPLLWRPIWKSVDASAPVHDRLRGRTGAWERVRDGVRALTAERGDAAFKLRANVVLMRETIGQFADLCTELADWGVDEITFNQLGGRDRPAFFPAQRLRPVEIAMLEATLPELQRKLAACGVILCGDARYLERLRASASGLALSVEDCRPGVSFLFIDEHGMASPCSFSGDTYGVPIASLRTPTDLDALPARFATARAKSRLAACDDCPSTQTFAKFAA
jgi:MoaA/NifB/PqqE/SkfB family radical SAM enzyme